MEEPCQRSSGAIIEAKKTYLVVDGSSTKLRESLVTHGKLRV
jgi:hypothetical protein